MELGSGLSSSMRMTTLQDVPAKTFEMECSIDPNYGEYWHGQVEIDASEKPHKKSVAQKGKMYTAIF